MKNKLYFDKEKKLKITAALLVALSGILAGIVELFSNCGCCCVNGVDCDLFLVKIVLLVLNVAAVLAALVADIMGICEYGKIPTDNIDNQCFDCPYYEELPNIADTYYSDDEKDKTIKAIVETPKKDTTAPDKRLSKQNGIFICSLITTAISFVLLCISALVVAII